MGRSFTLGEHFDQFIDEQLASGRYNNASEVVRAGLRLLEDAQEWRRLTVGDIRQSIEEGRKDRELLSAEDVFARLEARIGRPGG